MLCNQSRGRRGRPGIATLEMAMSLPFLILLAVCFSSPPMLVGADCEQPLRPGNRHGRNDTPAFPAGP